MENHDDEENWRWTGSSGYYEGQTGAIGKGSGLKSVESEESEYIESSNSDGYVKIRSAKQTGSANNNESLSSESQSHFQPSDGPSGPRLDGISDEMMQLYEEIFNGPTEKNTNGSGDDDGESDANNDESGSSESDSESNDKLDPESVESDMNDNDDAHDSDTIEMHHNKIRASMTRDMKKKSRMESDGEDVGNDDESEQSLRSSNSSVNGNENADLTMHEIFDSIDAVTRDNTTVVTPPLERRVLRAENALDRENAFHRLMEAKSRKRLSRATVETLLEIRNLLRSSSNSNYSQNQGSNMNLNLKESNLTYGLNDAGSVGVLNGNDFNENSNDIDSRMPMQPIDLIPNKLNGSGNTTSGPGSNMNKNSNRSDKTYRGPTETLLPEKQNKDVLSQSNINSISPKTNQEISTQSQNQSETVSSETSLTNKLAKTKGQRKVESPSPPTSQYEYDGAFVEAFYAKIDPLLQVIEYFSQIIEGPIVFIVDTIYMMGMILILQDVDAVEEFYEKIDPLLQWIEYVSQIIEKPILSCTDAIHDELMLLTNDFDSVEEFYKNLDPLLQILESGSQWIEGPILYFTDTFYFTFVEGIATWCDKNSAWLQRRMIYMLSLLALTFVTLRSWINLQIMEVLVDRHIQLANLELSVVVNHPDVSNLRSLSLNFNTNSNSNGNSMNESKFTSTRINQMSLPFQRMHITFSEKLNFRSYMSYQNPQVEHVRFLDQATPRLIPTFSDETDDLLLSWAEKYNYWESFSFSSGLNLESDILNSLNTDLMDRDTRVRYKKHKKMIEFRKGRIETEKKLRESQFQYAYNYYENYYRNYYANLNYGQYQYNYYTGQYEYHQNYYSYNPQQYFYQNYYPNSNQIVVQTEKTEIYNSGMVETGSGSMRNDEI